jgi:alcohol dehydrogenase YqhD (iron-dependent ADH family)
VKPVRERQIFQLVHALYFKAGLLKEGQKSGYDLRVHSIRKIVKTQLMALGVRADYADYMMGHTVHTYHGIQTKGIEFLRASAVELTCELDRSQLSRSTKW